VRTNDVSLLDVRAEGEWKAGHVPTSVNIAVQDLAQRLTEIPQGKQIIVHCQTGARAAIAASLLKARGFDDVSIFSGGFAEWSRSGEKVATTA
jgi:hydroxyacylglutathione hydrolase